MHSNILHTREERDHSSGSVTTHAFVKTQHSSRRTCLKPLVADTVPDTVTVLIVTVTVTVTVGESETAEPLGKCELQRSPLFRLGSPNI